MDTSISASLATSAPLLQSPYTDTIHPGRSKKEYVAGALMSIFSELLAMILNEVGNNWQEQNQTKERMRILCIEI